MKRAAAQGRRRWCRRAIVRGTTWDTTVRSDCGLAGTHMARQEQRREDILREATALVERAEFQLQGYAEPVVVGYRRDGSASFFFGDEYVFQFNSARQLRRVYYEGLLLKAEAGELVSLSRHRRADEVVLRRHNLTVEETNRMLAQVRQHLDQLAQELRTVTYTMVRQVPAEADIASKTDRWLAMLGDQFVIARRPHVGIRKP